MRYIGDVESKSEASRLTSYLVANGIDAQAETDSNDVWGIWIRNEDHLEQAVSEYQLYVESPEDTKYDGHENVAEQIRREETVRRSKAQKNVVEMRGKWGSGAPRGKIPVTMTLIGISVVVFIFTGFGEDGDSWLLRKLLFHDMGNYHYVYYGDVSAKLERIRQFEVWRIVSPIFLHFGPLHILMNMGCLFGLGGQVERRKGARKYLAIVFATAVISNLFQALVPAEFGGSTYSGGMSGVMYGVFGYVWMKAWYDRQDGFQISEFNILLLMGWLFLCMTGLVGNIGNWAHVVGLIVGILIVLTPIYLRDGKIG